MPLAKEPLAVLFAQGVDTKTDAKQVLRGKLLDLQNCVFTKEATLSKRNGYNALSTQVDGQALPYTNAQGLAKRGSELILFANALALSYRPSSNTWQQSSPVSSVVVASSHIARTGTKQTQPDAATNANITVVAWEDSRGGVWCSVVEAATNRILLPQVQLDAGAGAQRPRCLAIGGVLHVLWANGTSIIGAIINPANPAATPTQYTLTNDLNAANPAYDAVPTYNLVSAAFAPALIAWVVSPTQFRIGYVIPAGGFGGPPQGLPGPTSPIAGTDTTGPIACAINVSKAITNLDAQVLWAGGTTLRQTFVNPLTFFSPGIITLGPIGPTRVRIAVEYGSQDLVNGGWNSWWAAEEAGVGPDLNIIRFSTLNGIGAPGPLSLIRGHNLASRAYFDNGDVYCAVSYAVLFFPYVVVIQLSGSGRAQARLFPGLTPGQPLPRQHLPNAYAINLVKNGSGSISTGRQHQIPLGYRIQLAGTSGTQFGEQGIQLATIDHAHTDSYQSVELGRGLYLAGALIQHYDGDRWAEADFHTAPDTNSGMLTIGQGAGGGLTPLQTYSYIALYEEIDGQGELHPGSPSILQKITLAGGNGTVTISIPTLRLTSKKRVRIGVFRSLGNATGTLATIPLFRVSSVDPTAVGNNGYVLNDPTIDAINFTDVMADTVAATLEPLYTNGGILPNAPPMSSGDTIAVGKTRLFWTDPVDHNLVLFSQALRDETAAELAASLRIRVDPYGGNIVGLAVMDDNVIVFKQTAVYAFGGPGPAADGGLNTNTAFTPPQLLTSDVGASSPSTIAQTPAGLVFQTSKGMYLIGRDLHVRRIGDPVYAYKDQTITRAVLIPDRPFVVFLTNAGRTLLWDYDRDQWSTFTNHLGLDATVVNNVFTYLRTDGRVFQETIGQFNDGGAHVPMLIETAWLHGPQHMQGWQKVFEAQVLGAWKSKHTLRMRYRLDYEDAYSQPFDANVNAVFSPSTYGGGNYGGPGDGSYGGLVGLSSVVYQERFGIGAKCQAISFRFEDMEAASDYGASFELSELLLTVGIEGPDRKSTRLNSSHRL